MRVLPFQKEVNEKTGKKNIQKRPSPLIFDKIYPAFNTTIQ